MHVRFGNTPDVFDRYAESGQRVVAARQQLDRMYQAQGTSNVVNALAQSNERLYDAIASQQQVIGEILDLQF